MSAARGAVQVYTPTPQADEASSSPSPDPAHHRQNQTTVVLASQGTPEAAAVSQIPSSEVRIKVFEEALKVKVYRTRAPTSVGCAGVRKAARNVAILMAPGRDLLPFAIEFRP